MPLSGIAVAEIGIGGILLWSGVKGYTLADTFTDLAQGKTPQQSEQIDQGSATGDSSISSSAGDATGDTGAANATAAQNQALAKQLLAQQGLSSWATGQDWEDLVSLWNKESGWSATAQNPNSNAAGIAQNINGYGPDYEENNPEQQIAWGIDYIEQRYGSPAMAWAHEVANDWY